MRIPALEQYVVASLLEVGATSIEKIDWMTKALEVCYKNKQLNESWEIFTEKVISILNDAIAEARIAKSWTHTV